MDDDRSDVPRRTVLHLAAGLAAAAGTGALAAEPARAVPPKPTGMPGDFDFLAGEWKIRHQRLKDGTWDRFEGEATVRSLLGGIGTVERIPARNFSGLGLRLLDLQKSLWADYWVNAASGVLTPPPSWGSFVDGVGLWDSDDTDGGQPLIVRGAWDEITPASCRWTQATSRDGGRSWDRNWVMHWTRV